MYFLGPDVVEGSATKTWQRQLGVLSRVAAATAVLLPSYAATSDQDAMRIIHALGWPDTAVRISESLAIDTDPARRMIVPGRCEGSGERELALLARTAELEEAFAFLPDHCLWVEIGIDQTSYSVRIEREIIDELVERFRRVTIYHVHPQSFDSAGHFPAFSDLVGTILINGRYLRDARVKIVHRAVTPDGIFQYGFDPSEAVLQLIDAIFSTGLGAFAGENLALGYANREHEGCIMMWSSGALRPRRMGGRRRAHASRCGRASSSSTLEAMKISAPNPRMASANELSHRPRPARGAPARLAGSADPGHCRSGRHHRLGHASVGRPIPIEPIRFHRARRAGRLPSARMGSLPPVMPDPELGCGAQAAIYPVPAARVDEGRSRCVPPSRIEPRNASVCEGPG